MSFTNIFSALMAATKYIVELPEADKGLGDIPVRWPNAALEPPADGAPYATVDVLPAGVESITMGTGGEDEHTGVLQISLYYQANQGHGALVTACARLQQFFQAGTSMEYNGTAVRITQCSPSPPQKDGQRFASHVSVYYYARVNRSTLFSATHNFTPVTP